MHRVEPRRISRCFVPHIDFTDYRHLGLRRMPYKDHDDLIQYICGIQGVCTLLLPCSKTTATIWARLH